MDHRRTDQPRSYERASHAIVVIGIHGRQENAEFSRNAPPRSFLQYALLKDPLEQKRSLESLRIMFIRGTRNGPGRVDNCFPAMGNTSVERQNGQLSRAAARKIDVGYWPELDLDDPGIRDGSISAVERAVRECDMRSQQCQRKRSETRTHGQVRVLDSALGTTRKLYLRDAMHAAS